MGRIDERSPSRVGRVRRTCYCKVRRGGRGRSKLPRLNVVVSRNRTMNGRLAWHRAGWTGASIPRRHGTVPGNLRLLGREITVIELIQRASAVVIPAYDCGTRI